MCSKRWAKPVRPFGSRRKPMRYAMQGPNVGAEWSSETTTVSPFASFLTSVGMCHPAGLAAGTADQASDEAAQSAPAAIDIQRFVRTESSLEACFRACRGYEVGPAKVPKAILVPELSVHLRVSDLISLRGGPRDPSTERRPDPLRCARGHAFARRCFPVLREDLRDRQGRERRPARRRA